MQFRKHPSKMWWSALFAFFSLILILIVITPAKAQEGDQNCVSCHTDKARLEQLSQRASQVYVDLIQYQAEVHGALQCTTCHRGDPSQNTPETACVGIAYKDPAAPEYVRETCGECHQELVNRHLNSIHNTLNGIRNSLADFMGPQEGEVRFSASCNKCHASCSDCHMEKPGAHGVLSPQVENHQFAARPETEICVACHDGTGKTYTGDPVDPINRPPSSMFTAGMDCMSCHTEQDVHGSGKVTNFLSESKKPECEDCHTNLNRRVELSDQQTTIAPAYIEQLPAHEDHAGSLSCQACHTMWYENCWNCHQGREQKLDVNVFLAVNPMTELVHPAAHSPATAPDWGLIPVEIGGGWAIKSRHSWGTSLSCERCHTQDAIYITGTNRQAPFLGVWGPDRLNASYVDETLIRQIVIDQTAFQNSLHGDLACQDCHSTSDDVGCTTCHEKVDKTGSTTLPYGDAWKRTAYIAARENLRMIEYSFAQTDQNILDKYDWNERWGKLKESYLVTSNDFHGHPGNTLEAMQQIATESEQLRIEVAAALDSAKQRKAQMLVGIPFTAGILGALVLGWVVYRPRKILIFEETATITIDETSDISETQTEITVPETKEPEQSETQTEITVPETLEPEQQENEESTPYD